MLLWCPCCYSYIYNWLFIHVGIVLCIILIQTTEYIVVILEWEHIQPYTTYYNSYTKPHYISAILFYNSFIILYIPFYCYLRLNYLLMDFWMSYKIFLIVITYILNCYIHVHVLVSLVVSLPRPSPNA